MAKRQKRWARQERQRLRVRLGTRCAVCGTTASVEFDCILPQGHEHHRMDAATRTLFYRRQVSAGNLQLLCEKCHAKKTANEQDTDAGLSGAQQLTWDSIGRQAYCGQPLRTQDQYYGR
jgi:5-methylcytosine-specific restriction endonuclease McrA